MAAVLTPAEYEFAKALDTHEIPNRLRCAKCNRPVFEAMKTDCCDTSICKSCSEKLSKACPACSHPITSEMTREDKRTRVTLKAHIKGELQKRNNAQAAALAAQDKAEQIVTTTEPAVETADVIIESTEMPDTEPSPTAEFAVEANGEAMVGYDEDQDAADDHSSVEIITELPADHYEREAPEDNQEMQEELRDGDDPDQDNTQQGTMQQQNWYNSGQDGFNNSMNFGAMNGFNPMMAMQAGMGMPPFGMLSSMMGMPNMAMDPTMMFNGGFAGMNGMANMMNGNMMGGNFGMADMNDFTSYNHQYGNRFDDRSHGQSFFPPNRGYGRGRYGQNYRGRGQGYYNRDGRGRGGWNSQYHNHHNNNFSNHNTNYHQQHDNYGRERNGQRPDDQFDSNTRNHGDARDVPEEYIAQHDELDQSQAEPADTEAVQQEEALPQQTGEYIEDEVDYGDDVPIQAAYEPSNDHDPQQQQQQSTRPSPPPVNAPTGPKAMRDGLPNRGRYSRPQVSQNGREVVAEQSREESGGQIARPGSNASTVYAMKGEERDTRAKEYQQGVHGSHHRTNDRSRSRSPSRYENKRKTHGNRYEDTDADGSYEHRRYSREANYDNDDRSNRKEKKRSRDTENDYRAKKRSRSTTPDGSSSRHRHGHRDAKERSHRDHSRERRKTGHKYGGQDLPEEDEYHQRQKAKSAARPSRRDRNGNVERADREEAAIDTRPAVLAEHSDEIGFRIKGSKSREMRSSANTDMAPPTGPSAHHRDPYAAERERMKEQRLQRDAQRRQSVQSSGKRSRGDDEGDDDRNDPDDHRQHHHHHHHGRKKRSRPRAKYEDEIENHEHERESRRWR